MIPIEVWSTWSTGMGIRSALSLHNNTRRKIEADLSMYRETGNVSRIEGATIRYFGGLL
jgi:hypothetical protein